MKTGIGENPSHFEITFQALLAILKRASLKDSILFKEHNPKEIINSKTFANGVSFNLFSEYGIGGKLKDLLKELLKDGKITPNTNNIFFNEIVRLSPEIIEKIRSEKIQTMYWSYDYAIRLLNKVDDLSTERLERLKSLFEIAEISEYKNNKCFCGFCVEFRSYFTNETPEALIKSVIISISSEK